MSRSSSSNWLKNSISDLLDTIRNNVVTSILVLLCLLIGLLSAWSYMTTERITTTQYILTQHARLNDYYASELLLNQRSWDAIEEEVATTQMDMDLLTLVENLPESTDYSYDENSDNLDSDEMKAETSQSQSRPVLIIRSIGDSLLTDDKYQELIDWIEQGGHLITFSNDSVDEDEWQAVQQRIKDISEDKIDSDSELEKLLTDINKTTSNSLLNKLNIYPVQLDHDFYFYESDESDTENDVKINTKEYKAYKEFQATLDELGLKLEKTDEDADTDENNEQKKDTSETTKVSNKTDKTVEPVINLSQVREHIEELYESQSVLMLSVDGNSFMIDSGNDRYIDSQLFFANHPQAKVNKKLNSASIKQIRHFLQSQLTVIEAMIKQGAKVEKRNLKNGSLYFTPKEQQKTVKVLMNLSDEQLQAMFTKVNNSLLDSDFGAGRITVLDNRNIWDNPNEMVINDAKQQKDFSEGKKSASIFSLLSLLKSPEIELFNNTDTNLYSKNNATLLINLTEDSVQAGESIWLFPNVDIDSLPIMLWKKSRLAVLGLGLLTFIWLWSLYNRFGKPEYLDNSQSADIFRYFRQIGRYGWEYDKAKRLSKVTRAQADKLAKKALALKTNEPITQAHMSKLSQLLQTRLSERLQEHMANDEMLAMLVANQKQIEKLLTAEQLEVSLLPTASDLDSFTAHGFTEYTQTLWLVKWLLG